METTDYERQRKNLRSLRELRGEDVSMHDNTELASKLGKLLEIGFSAEAIATTATVSRSTVHRIADGTHPMSRPAIFHLLNAVTAQSIYAANLSDETDVAAFATQRRLRALYRIGWTRDSVGALVHAERPDVLGAFPIQTVLSLPTSIHFVKHTAVRNVYNRIKFTPGHSSLNISRGKAAKTAPPMAWDDIENFSERPKGVC